MITFIVVNNPEDWPIQVPGVEVVAARQYLSDPTFSDLRNAKVFNLCRSYSYQSLGYYVSLLAEARGHRPQPDVVTIQDMKSNALVRVITDELDELIQRTLKNVRPQEFVLSIYFGATLAKRDQALGQRLFGLFRAPTLRATLVHKEKWQLQNVRPVPGSELPESHQEFIISAAERFFRRGQPSGTTAKPPRYYLAILHDPDEIAPPSNEAAIAKIVRAAQRARMSTEMITRDDFARIGEFDALLIRTTTYVNHYTYRFARRAAAEGLAVIDDPVSIARCTNKVYFAESMMLHKVPTPRSMIVSRDTVDACLREMGLPMVLKQPDSAFSQGVVKAETEEEYRQSAEKLLEKSEMVIAQKFMPTEFDWRVGILDGKPLFVCKYHMARGHWQIMRWNDSRHFDYGKVEPVPLHEAPRRVVSTAVRAARLIGDGFYGVDLKQTGQQIVVMEVNDNPNLDAGFEDRILKDELYDRLIDYFVRRIERIREGGGKRGR